MPKGYRIECVCNFKLSNHFIDMIHGLNQCLNIVLNYVLRKAAGFPACHPLRHKIPAQLCNGLSLKMMLREWQAHLPC